MVSTKFHGRDFCAKFSVETLTKLIDFCIKNHNTYLPPFHFISAHACVEGGLSEELAKIYTSGKLVCDSKPLSLYLSRVLKMQVPQVRGADFMRTLLLTAPKGSRHYFLGGTDETLSGISNFILRNRHLDLVCEYSSPEFNRIWDEISSYELRNIELFAADFVWVGMGAPKQFYISQEISKKLNITSLSVGAAFDFIAETKFECPKFISNIGLEWLFRLITEPRRLWKRYLIGNWKFVSYLLDDFRRHRRESNQL